MLKEHYKVYEEKMKKSVEAVERDFGAVRAGRANASVLNRIQVDYYGTPTPLQQVGNISVPEARMIVIQPWEKSLIKPIEKAIQTSDLGINPQSDGKVIRLIFPPLTEERRATGIFGILTIRENTVIASLKRYTVGKFILSKRKMAKATDWSINAMRIKTPSQMTKIQSLSGGNQQKVIFGRWMLTAR